MAVNVFRTRLAQKKKTAIDHRDAGTSAQRVIALACVGEC